MTNFKPRAFSQGELDHLCGVYAVINAVRQTFLSVRPLKSKDCLWLFNELITYLDRRSDLHRAVTAGLGSRDITRLLKESCRQIDKLEVGSLFFSQPFSGATSLTVDRVAAKIRHHQKKSGGGVLLGFSGHWTEVRVATATRFRLLDSIGYRSLPFEGLTIGRPKAGENVDWILKNWIWTLSHSTKAN